MKDFEFQITLKKKLRYTVRAETEQQARDYLHGFLRNCVCADRYYNTDLEEGDYVIDRAEEQTP